MVAALGFGTAGLAVGDEVFGLTDQLRDGAAAEYVAVEARDLARKPKTVDHAAAAAVPRAGLTAWQALFDHGNLVKGQTVVIHGAGGAVGSMAVQLARRAGAEVSGPGAATPASWSWTWAPTVTSRWTPRAWTTSRAPPTWSSTRSAARCWLARTFCSSPAGQWSR